jgi:hypothetical protein
MEMADVRTHSVADRRLMAVTEHAVATRGARRRFIAASHSVQHCFLLLT